MSNKNKNYINNYLKLYKVDVKNTLAKASKSDIIYMVLILCDKRRFCDG